MFQSTRKLNNKFDSVHMTHSALEGGGEKEEESNGVFRGLVLWILTSQLVWLCVYVCVCVWTTLANQALIMLLSYY